MHVANYCAECGARLKRSGWRAWLKGSLCEDCGHRLGKTSLARPLAVIAIIAIAAFALGRYLRARQARLSQSVAAEIGRAHV